MMQVKELFENNILIYIMAGLCGFGVLVKIFIQIIYKNLINASDNMANTKNKLMKLVKMKFEACYKLKIGVNNVDIFVDKYIYKYKFCGILLYTWENISGQILILCLLTGAVGAGLAVYYDCGRNAILSTFFIGLLTSALLIIFESFLNLPAKRNIIRINMKDYLENMFKVRLEHEYIYPDKLEEYRNEYFDARVGEKLEDKDNKEEHNLEDKQVQPIMHKERHNKIEDTAVTKEIKLDQNVSKAETKNNNSQLKNKEKEIIHKKERSTKSRIVAMSFCEPRSW